MGVSPVASLNYWELYLNFIRSASCNLRISA
jgi:hypothetical protein